MILLSPYVEGNLEVRALRPVWTDDEEQAKRLIYTAYIGYLLRRAIVHKKRNPLT